MNYLNSLSTKKNNKKENDVTHLENASKEVNDETKLNEEEENISNEEMENIFAKFDKKGKR